MAGISKAISNELFLKCHVALKQQGKSGKVARKLQAIISAKNHNISQVAKIFGMTRATLFKWIKDFKHQSIDGLLVKKGRGRKRLLDNVQEQFVVNSIASNPSISVKDLQQIIFKKRHTAISIASTYRLMHKLGFNHITARKNHHKQDGDLLETFKKTAKNALRK